MLGPGFELSINPKTTVNLSYKANLNLIETQVAERGLGSIQQFKHVVELDIFPFKDHLLSVVWEYYDNTLSSNREMTHFVDLRYRYRIAKSKWDVNLHAQNILNNNNFGTFTADAFMIRQQTFLLRPRQVLVSVNFSF